MSREIAGKYEIQFFSPNTFGLRAFYRFIFITLFLHNRIKLVAIAVNSGKKFLFLGLCKFVLSETFEMRIALHPKDGLHIKCMEQ